MWHISRRLWDYGSDFDTKDFQFIGYFLCSFLSFQFSINVLKPRMVYLVVCCAASVYFCCGSVLWFGKISYHFCLSHHTVTSFALLISDIEVELWVVLEEYNFVCLSHLCIRCSSHQNMDRFPEPFPFLLVLVDSNPLFIFSTTIEFT